ncbi:MAG TPA: hypothetical protein VFD70_08380 [Anaerolineae bacterium]|nr:hypothetical protein [Anaerolineae bacterium]
MTFFRMTESEAQIIPGIQFQARLEGIPLYLHQTLKEFFMTHPLVLSSRGPRLVIERDEALVLFEAELRANLKLDDHEPDEFS